MIRAACAMAVAMVAAASCASAGAASGGFDAQPASDRGTEDRIWLRVMNTANVDFDVHVMHTGKPGVHRLGRVLRLSSADFELEHPEALADGFFLIVQPVGTTTGFVSKEFRALAGERIVAQISPAAIAAEPATRGM